MAARTERFPHITRDPAIQGGAAVVASTRLPVRTVAFYWRETHDRQRLLRNYPQLTPALLDEVIGYYQAHQAEIDAELRIADDGWLFPGRFPGRPLSRMQAWSIVRAASQRAGVRVLALRTSQHSQRGEPAPIDPHLFRPARVRQIVRTTRSLPIGQKQAGGSRLQMAYLSVGDGEVRAAMELIPD